MSTPLSSTASAPASAASSWEEARAWFPLLQHTVYLDVSKRGPVSRLVSEGLEEYAAALAADGGAKWFAAANGEAARATVAKLLHVSARTLAFVKNTSEGLNILAHSLELAPGDNVVLTTYEHENNICAWRRHESRGVEMRWVAPVDGRLDAEDFDRVIDRRTRVVSVSHVACATGFRLDLPALSRLCRERGVRLVVDAVQGLGVLDTDWSATGVDAMVGGAYKGLLGLHGVGVMYCREELIAGLRPPFLARSSLRRPDATAPVLELADDARRFEIGNPNYLGVDILRRVAERLLALGPARIEERVQGLSTLLLERLHARGLPVVTPRAWPDRAGIVSLRTPDAEAAAARLRAKGILVSPKGGLLRISLHFYNTEEDIEKLVAAL